MAVDVEKKYKVISEALLLRTGTQAPDHDGRVMAYCPSHPDGKNHGFRGGQSLTLTNDGLLHCYKGCTATTEGFNGVLKLIGVDPREWMESDFKPREKRSLTKVFYYKNELGELIAEKGRFEAPSNPKDKEFFWRLPGQQGWPGLKPLNLKDMPLYGAEYLVNVSNDEPVWFVEGEKATDAVRASGQVAVCAAGGAGTKDFGKALDVLRRKTVYLFPDKDAPDPARDFPDGEGVAYMRRVAALLSPVARSVKMVDVHKLDILPLNGADAVEWLATGATMADLPLVEIQPDLKQKKQPHDTLAEATAIAGFFDEEFGHEIMVEVQPEDFYSKSGSLIASACYELADMSQAINENTVANRLERASRLADVGGRQYIASLTRMAPTKQQAVSAAEIVKRDGAWRRIISLGIQLTKWGFAAGDDLDETLGEAEDILANVKGKEIGQVRSVKEVVAKDWDYIFAFLEDPSRLAGLPTGFGSLDRLLDGLEGGRLYTVAGRTSQGKSMFAANLMVEATSRFSTPFLFFAEEMSAEQVARRILFGRAGINRLWHRDKGVPVSDEKQRELVGVTGQIGELPIFFYDTMGSTSQSIRAISRRMVRKHGIKVVVIDHIDLIHNPVKGNQNRHQELSAIYSHLKTLAREMNIAVVALSQISRAPDKRQDPRPLLSDLRESGSKEEDSDVVMFVHQPHKYDAKRNKNLWEILVAKNRDGGTGMIPFYGDPGLQLMMEWDEQSHGPMK